MGLSIRLEGLCWSHGLQSSRVGCQAKVILHHDTHSESGEIVGRICRTIFKGL